MAEELVTQLPPAWSRFEADAGERGAALGGLCRVLAASRPGGVLLAVGDGAGAAGIWIRHGMDLASRLVIVTDADAAGPLRAELDDDLRVTVHVQDPAGFLADVHAHRFDLVVDASPDPPRARTRLAVAGLAPGGLYVTRGGAAGVAEAISGGNETRGGAGRLFLATLPGAPGITLVARGPAGASTRRRGGRRARRGVTPLFASRGRRGG